MAVADSGAKALFSTALHRLLCLCDSKSNICVHVLLDNGTMTIMLHM